MPYAMNIRLEMPRCHTDPIEYYDQYYDHRQEHQRARSDDSPPDIISWTSWMNFHSSHIIYILIMSGKMW